MLGACVYGARCSLRVARLFVRCLLAGVCCMLVVVCRLLIAVRCVLFVVARCVLSAVCVGCGLLFVVCFFLRDVLFDVCCALFAVVY